MATALITLSYLARSLNFAPNENIDQRRLADTTCPEQRNRSGEIRREGPERFPIMRTDGMDCEIGRDRSHRRFRLVDLFGCHRVGLGQQHNRSCTTVERKNEFTLQTTRIDSRRRRMQEEHDIDVGRNDVGHRSRTLE